MCIRDRLHTGRPVLILDQLSPVFVPFVEHMSLIIFMHPLFRGSERLKTCILCHRVHLVGRFPRLWSDCIHVSRRRVGSRRDVHANQMHNGETSPPARIRDTVDFQTKTPECRVRHSGVSNCKGGQPLSSAHATWKLASALAREPAQALHGDMPLALQR